MSDYKADILNSLSAGLQETVDAAVLGNTMYRSEDGIVRFVREIIKPDKGIHPYQEDILRAFYREKRIAFRGPHGIGKSAMMSWLVLWGMSVYPPEVDVKIVTTASAWRQLEKFLWPEIRKWARKADWGSMGVRMRDGQELLSLSLRLPNKEAFAAASDNPAYIEGAHATVVIYIFDEAKTIPDGTWDAAEGAFSQEGLDGHDAFAAAGSTPGESLGRFYDIHARKPGFEDWWVRHVTLQEAIDAGQISRQWADQREKQWGKDSPVFQRRVLGNFSSGSHSAIPLDWIEASNELWLQWSDGKYSQDGESTEAIGCDPGGSGNKSDETAVAHFKNYIITRLDEYVGYDTKQIARLLELRNQDKTRHMAVDQIGIGVGVVDNLRHKEQPVFAVNVSEPCHYSDVTGELEFLNLRAWLWWTLGEFLNPNKPRGITMLLPPNEKLTGELIMPRWKPHNRGMKQIESKDEIRKRLSGKSTNLADAIMLAMYASLMGSSHGIWV